MKGSYRLLRAVTDLVDSMRRRKDAKWEQAISARKATLARTLLRRKEVLGF